MCSHSNRVVLVLRSASVERGVLCQESRAAADFAGREGERRSTHADGSSTACSPISEPQKVTRHRGSSPAYCPVLLSVSTLIPSQRVSSLLCSIRHVLDRGFPMLLCAVASDSTLVYQRMTDGLVTPDPPAGPFQDLGRRQHRKRQKKH